MNDKQRRFCEEYIVDMNATQAAIRAGYSKKTAAEQASRLLTKVNVQEYIHELMEEQRKSTIASAEEVMETLTRILRREEKEVVVMMASQKESHYDSNGKKITVETQTPIEVKIPSRLTDTNKAAELLGKRWGIYTDKVDMTGQVPVIIQGADELED